MKGAKASGYPFLNLAVRDILTLENYAMLPLEARGLLFDLIMRVWSNGSVPASPADLARLVGAPPEQIAELLPRLAAFTAEKGGRINLPMLEAERRRVHERTEKKARAGAESGRKRREAATERKQIQMNMNTCSRPVQHLFNEQEHEQEHKQNDDGSPCRDISPPIASAAACACAPPDPEQVAERIFKTIAPGDPQGEWKTNRTPLTNLVRECGAPAVESAVCVVLNKMRHRERFRRGPFAYLTDEARRIAAQPTGDKPTAKPRRFAFPETDAQQVVWAFAAGPDRSNGSFLRAKECFRKHTPTMSDEQRDEVARRLRGMSDSELRGHDYRFFLEEKCEEVANEQA